MLGASSVSLPELAAWAAGTDVPDTARSILENVRVPRVLAALLAGAALATSGALIQASLDNPLASPNVIGVNSGAGLFVLLAASLAPGDILLPERWTPEAPRLLLPGDTALACRLENGVLSVLGPDATLPSPCGGYPDSSEVTMTESVSEHAAGGTPLLDREAVAALELPVTFELARLSLRVEEIAALAPGYTFALNGDASSVPVLLRIGGRIAARGRLVDVGGMPGVQITGMADAAGGSAEESANPESRAEGN